MDRVDVKAAALAVGLVCGAYMFLLGIMASFGWGGGLVQAISSLYRGYAPGFPGALVGALWGFIDGAVGAAVIACIYNRLACRK